MIQKYKLYFLLMLILIGCSPPAPYKTHCIGFRIVPGGTTMHDLAKTEQVYRYTGSTTIAYEDRYCFINKAADVGSGRLEPLAQDRISLRYYLVAFSCKNGDHEVPMDLQIFGYNKWWDKYKKVYKYTTYPPGETSNGNYCYTGDQTFATNNNTFETNLYSFAYHRLEMNPKVLELESFVLVEKQ